MAGRLPMPLAWNGRFIEDAADSNVHSKQVDDVGDEEELVDISNCFSSSSCSSHPHLVLFGMWGSTHTHTRTHTCRAAAAAVDRVVCVRVFCVCALGDLKDLKYTSALYSQNIFFLTSISCSIKEQSTENNFAIRVNSKEDFSPNIFNTHCHHVHHNGSLECTGRPS